ncbi:MAG: hypothetical protein IM600_00655 [Bacteroidetes bacterium]|nr:hypothetical protein [Bacteroidota bacterium]MCA6441911.1 hypothetical protein [Bacteroidota bacterium]
MKHKSRKKFKVVIFILIFSKLLVSQTQKSNLMIEGSTGDLLFNRNIIIESGTSNKEHTKNTNFNASFLPTLLYFLNNNLALGLSFNLGYAYANQDFFDLNYRKTGNFQSSTYYFGLNPIVRYYFTKNTKNRFYFQLVSGAFGNNYKYNSKYFLHDGSVGQKNTGTSIFSFYQGIGAFEFNNFLKNNMCLNST